MRSTRGLNIAFVIVTDAQLEIAEEVARELRLADSRCIPWVISQRWFKRRDEFDRSLLSKTFSHVVMPLQTPRLGGVFRRIVRWLCGVWPGPWHRSLALLRLCEWYPHLLYSGNLFKFDFAFTMNDKPKRLFVKAFQAAGVPVALLQESLRHDPHGEMEQPWNGQGGCDVIYAWGESSNDYYLSVGVPRERIMIVGSPRMDRYLSKAARISSAKVIKAEEGIPKEMELVLIATGSVYHPELLRRPLPLAEYLDVIGEAIGWCRKLGAFALVKPHPNVIKDYETWGVPNWINSFPNARYRTDFDLAKVVSSSKAVLIFNATVALEAQLLGKPAGMLAADRYGHGVDFLKRGLAVKVDCCEDLRNLMSLRSRVSDALLETYVADRGQSARTIAQDVLERVSGSGRDRLPKK
jgi:hypothetical protein